MLKNKETIERFYSSFQNKDFEAMAKCYHPDIEFHDPVFETLRGVQVGAMWRMLIEKSESLTITFSQVAANETSGSAQWEAIYPFGKDKRLIHNKISAKFQFKDGLIIHHQDHFDLWRWAAMALGITGSLLGWTSGVQQKIRKEAQIGLQMFMKRKRLI